MSKIAAIIAIIMSAAITIAAIIYLYNMQGGPLLLAWVVIAVATAIWLWPTAELLALLFKK